MFCCMEGTLAKRTMIPEVFILEMSGVPDTMLLAELARSAFIYSLPVEEH